MKALIFKNKVIELSENEFPVNKHMVWVDSETAEVGDSYSDGTLSKLVKEVIGETEVLKKRLKEIDSMLMLKLPRTVEDIINEDPVYSGTKALLDEKKTIRALLI